ncbi:MAG: hypothetical protein IK095_08230 [Oscillospiraceae bacterium]|nr:hypothetical protein [Oscillospiraceae bacterium]
MKKSLKTALALLLIVLVLGGALYGLDRWTAPIVQARQAAEEEAAAAAGQEMLLALLPGSAAFDLIYDAQDPAASALQEVPAAVQSIYAERDGLGYVLALTTSDGYTKEPIEFSMGVDREGKISGMEVTAYPAEERDISGAGLPASFVGQDSALPEVELVANMTVSSTAFKNAVLAGFDALIGNDLVGAGVKDDSQILRELIPVLAPGLAASTEELAVEGDILQAGWKSDIGTLAAFLIQDGGKGYVVLSNVEGLLQAYDVDGNDSTEALSEAARAAVGEVVARELKPFTDSDIAKFQRIAGEGAEVEALPLPVVNSVVGVYRITTEEGVLYGFAARTRGFADAIQSYYLLDENGAIVKTSISALIQEEEYFAKFGGMDADAYREGFVGLTGETWNEDVALIATATVSSSAMQLATADVFETFRVLAENGGLDA